MDLIAAFCLFMRTLPINWALLRGTGNIKNQRRQCGGSCARNPPKLSRVSTRINICENPPHCYKDYLKWSSPLENCSSRSEKSPLLVLQHFAPCPYWYFTSFYAGNIFRSQKQDLLLGVTGKFRKILKLKMSGKTAGDLPHGEGKSRTLTFSANVDYCNFQCPNITVHYYLTSYTGATKP